MENSKKIGFWTKLIKHGVTFKGTLRLGVLLCSLILIGCISYDTFLYSNPFEQTPFTKNLLFWVCIFFMIDIVLEFIVSKHKSRYLFTYILLFLSCVPYLTILPLFHLTIPRDLEYLLRFAPLIRSSYGLAIVVGWFTFRASSKLFITYILILVSGIYIGSLAFYTCEVNVNPLVKTYWDALWWASMEAITVGCNIEAVTTIGKFLSVFVAVLGMLVIPMFTVYVTNLVGVLQTASQQEEARAAQNNGAASSGAATNPNAASAIPPSDSNA